MISTKKGIHSHIIIIAITTVFMTLLLTTVLTTFIKNDDIKCKDIKYEITNKCSESKSFTITVKNDHTEQINFLVENTQDDFKVQVDSTTTTKIVTEDDIIRIIPFITEPLSGEKKLCNSKDDKFDKKSTKKC